MIRINKIRLGSVVVLLCIVLITTVLSPSATTPALAARKPTRTATSTMIPTLIPTATSTPTPAASPDFALWTNRMSPWWTGYLVRGGLRKVDCPLCQSDFEPRYVTFDYGECSYANNTIDLVPLNGFEGTITLEILNHGPFELKVRPNQSRLCQLIIEEVSGVPRKGGSIMFSQQSTPLGSPKRRR